MPPRQDQTDPKYAKRASSYGSGTGIVFSGSREETKQILARFPRHEILGNVVLLYKIALVELRARASKSRAEAFKWIPGQVMDQSIVMDKVRTGCIIEGQECRYTCRAPGCVCRAGKCQNA